MATSGAILVGGRGERLGGRAKALLPVGPSGEPLVVGVARAIAAVASPVFLCGGDPGLVSFLGLRHLPDTVPGRGPLGGLLSALAASPHERCLVVACDMPFLSVPLLAHLASVAAERRVDAVVPRTARGLHPLHAVYSRGIVSLVSARLDAGRLSLRDLLDDIATLAVDEPELRRYDPLLVSLENVNTPEDLARAFGADGAARILGEPPA